MWHLELASEETKRVYLGTSLKNKEASALRAVAILRELGLSAAAPNVLSPPLTLSGTPAKTKRQPPKPVVPAN